MPLLQTTTDHQPKHGLYIVLIPTYEVLNIYLTKTPPYILILSSYIFSL